MIEKIIDGSKKTVLGSIALSTLLYTSSSSANEFNAVNKNAYEYISYARKVATFRKINNIEFIHTTKMLINTTKTLKDILFKYDDKEVISQKSKIESISELYTEIIALMQESINRDIFKTKELKYANDLISASTAIQELINHRFIPSAWEFQKENKYASNLIKYGEWIINQRKSYAKIKKEAKQYECLFTT